MAGPSGGGEMFADETRPLRRDLFRLLGHPNPEEVLTRTLAPLWVGLGPRRIRVVENAILVPNGGILDSNGETLPDGQLRRFPQRQLTLGQEQIDPVEPVTTIPGDAIYLGWSFEHFGHFLVESMARWWAVEHLPQNTPLVALAAPGATGATVRLRMASLGFNPERMMLAGQPTRVPRLLLPDPMFEVRHSIHEDAARLFQDIADRIAGPSRPSDQPLYLSRGNVLIPGRRIQHESLFEEFLTRQGWRVIRPDALSIADQIRAIRRHRHIAGHIGTAFHLMQFTDHRPHLHMFTYDGVKSNYPLWADPLDTPITFLECATAAKTEDHAQRNLLLFDMAAAVAYLHAAGLVNTPHPPVPG